MNTGTAALCICLQNDGSSIVGHTDNAGPAARNLDQSQRRAERVVKTFVTKYQVDAKRLDGRGVGPFAPVASNRTEDGRSKNRRVELVER